MASNTPCGRRLVPLTLGGRVAPLGAQAGSQGRRTMGIADVIARLMELANHLPDRAAQALQHVISILQGLGS